MSEFYGIHLTGIARSLLSGQPMACIGYGYAVVDETVAGFNHPDLEALCVNTQGMGNHGEFFLKGKTTRGRRVVRKATLRQWRRAGLTALQAEMLWEVPGLWKHELVIHVASLMKASREAAETFPHKGRGARVAWEARWGMLRGLSFPRAEQAARLAREIWLRTHGPAPTFRGQFRPFPVQGNGWRFTPAR